MQGGNAAASVPGRALECDVEMEPDRLARFMITSGFPFWTGSLFEIGGSTVQSARGTGTNAVFSHYGFEDGYPEQELAMTAHTWAMILSSVKGYAETGAGQPALE